MLYKLLSEGNDPSNLEYILSKNISPYMETNMEEINYNLLINERQKLEINPYYRFDHILSSFLDPNIMEKKELREKIFNIIIHILSNIDLQEGLNKRIILNRLIVNDIENGVYGEKLKFFFKELKVVYYLVG